MPSWQKGSSSKKKEKKKKNKRECKKQAAEEEEVANLADVEQGSSSSYSGVGPVKIRNVDDDVAMNDYNNKYNDRQQEQHQQQQQHHMKEEYETVNAANTTYDTIDLEQDHEEEGYGDDGEDDDGEGTEYCYEQSKSMTQQQRAARRRQLYNNDTNNDTSSILEDLFLCGTGTPASSVNKNFSASMVSPTGVEVGANAYADADEYDNVYENTAAAIQAEVGAGARGCINDAYVASLSSNNLLALAKSAQAKVEAEAEVSRQNEREEMRRQEQQQQRTGVEEGGISVEEERRKNGSRSATAAAGTRTRTGRESPTGVLDDIRTMGSIADRDSSYSSCLPVELSSSSFTVPTPCLKIPSGCSVGDNENGKENENEERRVRENRSQLYWMMVVTFACLCVAAIIAGIVITVNNNNQQQQQQQSIAESNNSNINSNSNTITSAINSNGDTVATTTTTTTTANNDVLGSTSDEIPNADAVVVVVVNTTSTTSEEESTTNSATKEETIATTTTTTIDSLPTDGSGGSGSGNEDKEDNNNEDGGTSEIESTNSATTKEETIAAADTTTIDSPIDGGSGSSSSSDKEDGGNSATKEEETLAAPTTTTTTIDLSTDGRESFVEKLHGIQLLLEVSFPATTTTALNTLGSPQARAFDWLVQSDGLALSVDTASVTELEQRFAAATFYFATNNNGVSESTKSNDDDGDEEWTASLGFLSATSICQWNDGKYGIFCHNDDDERPTVKQIRIVDNNLSGSIPDEIKYFAELETLDLYYNKLTGTIPDLFRLSTLQQLDVDGNMLSGVIPGSLFNHPSLVNIYLLNNEKLTGTFPDHLSTNLEKISLSGCSFTGSLPPSLTTLSTLRLFEVKENALTGTIPVGLLSLPQLDTLGLHGNRFVGRIPSPLIDIDTNDSDNDNNKQEGSVLRSLSLGSNSLTGSLPDGMEVLTALQFFYAHDNVLTGTIRGEVIDLPLLRQLWLYDNKLSGEIPAFSYPLSSSSSSSSNTVLTELYLNDNDLSGNLHDLLASAPTTIERFDLSNNPKLGGFISDDISLFESLSYFVVSHCSLVGDLPAESLHQLVNVHSFDVAENQLESTIPTEIGSMINLQELNLSRNVFTGILPGEELSNLVSLTSFDVSQNPYLRGDLTSTVCTALGNQLVFAAADCAATAAAVVEGGGDPARSLGLAEGNSLGLADGSLGLAAGFSEGVDCACCLCS